MGLRWSYLVGRDPSNTWLDKNLKKDLSFETWENFGKPRCRKRGRRSGVRQCVRRLQSKNRILLPSIIMTNAQSLRNNTDELQGDVLHVREFRDACVLAFTETWLSDSDCDSSLEISCFGVPMHLDWDSEVTRKTQGGGVCLDINRRWCSNCA